MKKLLIAVFLTSFLHGAFAAVSDAGQLLETAIEKGGTAEDELTGPMADMIKNLTKSKAIPRIRVQSKGMNGKCFVANMTIMQADIPTRTGEIAGNYEMVTKLTLCPEGKLPPGVKGQEFVSCKIGNVDCSKY